MSIYADAYKDNGRSLYPLRIHDGDLCYPTLWDPSAIQDAHCTCKYIVPNMCLSLHKIFFRVNRSKYRVINISHFNMIGIDNHFSNKMLENNEQLFVNKKAQRNKHSFKCIWEFIIHISRSQFMLKVLG